MKPVPRAEPGPLTPWIIPFSLLSFFLHLAFYDTLGFHRDELLYFSLGQHPDAGYASVPPMIGLVAWMMIRIGGYSLLAVRIVPMLLGGGLVFLAGAIARELKGGAYAQILAAFTLCAAGFHLRTYFMFMPVSFDIFFWTLNFWILLKWVNTGKKRYLWLFGLVTGLGMMNKYLILLQTAVFLFTLLLSPHRAIFGKKAIYVSMALAVAVFLPNLAWQLAHGLPALTHMKALHDSQLVHVSRINFLADQFFTGGMAGFVIFPGVVCLFRRQGHRQARFFAVSAILVVALLCLLRGKSYYALGVFPFWIAAGSVSWERDLTGTFPRILLPLVITVLTLPVFPMGVPVYGPAKLVSYFERARKATGFDAVLRWEDGRIHPLPQDYADMLGWDEIAFHAARAWNQVPDKAHAMLYAENYGQAGAVMVIGKKYGLPEPACFNESFNYWVPKRLDHEITTLVYINFDMGDDVKGMFSNIRVIGQVNDTLARECGTTVWLCSEPRRSFRAFWNRIAPTRTPFD